MDLDGTAVQPDGRVSPRLKEAVRGCLGRGIHVILATGRMVQSAARYWRELELQPGPLIAYQGAVVAMMPEGRIVAQVNLPEAGAKLAVTWALDHDLLTQVYVGPELWVSREDARVRNYIEVNHIPAWVRGPLELTEWPEPPIKILLQDQAAVLDDVRGDLEALVAAYPMRVFKSQADYLELVSNEVGKAVGLAAAARILGVDQHRVLAIGDAENDIDMLEWAGFSVAMGQAPEHVKSAADVVTERVDEDGAAHAIERWVLEMGVQEG